MSTILKALRRLEQEKSSQSDRPLGEAVANTPPAPAPSSARTTWLIAAASLVGALAVTAVALLVLRGDPEPPPGPVTIAQAPSATESKSARSSAALPARRVARPSAPTDAREPQRRPVPPETAESMGLSRAALSSPDVEVVALPEPPAVEGEADAPEAVVLRRREPPRPGAGMPRPLEAQDPIEAGSPTEPVDPPQLQGGSAKPVVVAAAPTAPPKREAPAAPPAPEAKPMTTTAAGSAEPEPEAAAPRVVSLESTKRTNRTPALTAPSSKSPPRPAAPEAKAPVKVAAVVPPVKPAPPPRPAVKPAPEAKASVPAEEREVLKTLPAQTEPPTVHNAAAASDVYVQRTIWHPLADRRVAIVSLGEGAEAVELREGDSLGPFVVGEIEPTGVYFQRGDEELRRRVGAH